MAQKDLEEIEPYLSPVEESNKLYGEITLYRGEAQRGAGICQGAEDKGEKRRRVSGIRGGGRYLVCRTSGNDELSGELRSVS